VRKSLARHLLRNAEAHEAGSHNYLDKGYGEIERAVPREGYPEIETFLIALDFWRAWIEAGRRGWRGSEGIEGTDWPRLARRIVAALESDLDVDDPTILGLFGPRKMAGNARGERREALPERSG
jgi:hypothetical protein